MIEKKGFIWHCISLMQGGITTIGKRAYMPGIFNIPGIHQHDHQRSFDFFLWCISGICHIPHIHQTLSHLQKIPICNASCNDIGLFMVMYARHTESVDSGGYQGLVHQANVANKEDSSGLSDRNEMQLAYMMQKILIGIKGDLKDVFMHFQSKMRDMVNTGQTSCTTKSKFPRTGTDARLFFTDGTHSILKNFPVQEVFEVDNHA